MAKPPYQVVEYREEALSRVTEQFKEADVFQRYLITLIDGYDDIQTCLQQLLQMRSLDTAEGAQLDILGNIVGQDRVLVEADIFQYFGMQGYPEAQPFGDLSNPNFGGFFYSLGESVGGNIRLTDDLYRLFIRAKIFKNSFTATPEEFITAINYIFQTPITAISHDGEGTAVVFFGRELSTLERVLINYVFEGENYPIRLLPKTVGVQLEFGHFRPGEYFGFQGGPGAKGFGSFAKGIGGYGLDYGMNYGSSGDSQNTMCIDSVFNDGEFMNDGTIQFNGGKQCFSVDGGFFASLYTADF